MHFQPASAMYILLDIIKFVVASKNIFLDSRVHESLGLCLVFPQTVSNNTNENFMTYYLWGTFNVVVPPWQV